MKRLVALLLACGVLLTGCLWDGERRLDEDIIDEFTDATFYDLPDEIPAGDPGDILRIRPILSAPFGSEAWRIIFHTTDLNGKDVLASAVLAVPSTPAPSEGRTIVSWGHPTTGQAQSCAPSVLIDPFALIEGLEDLLLAGYAVVATDYPGMGVAGDSSYLIGVTEGNSMLDAARAARNLEGTNLSNSVLLWGHSQGGQAALFAAQGASYAPDLDVVAVAVAAPAADLGTLMTDDIDTRSGVTIVAYAFPSFEAAYADQFSQDELRAVLTPAGAASVDALAELCLFTQEDKIGPIADPLVGGFVTSNPATTPPWQDLLAENSAGGAPVGIPMFIGQGLADTTVVPTATEAYVKLLCDSGEQVEFRTFEGVTHALAADVAAPYVVDWFAAAMAGTASHGTCGKSGNTSR